MTSPNILFACDFPPSNFQGGSILASRLLADYPMDHVTVLSGSYYSEVSPQDGRLKCRHYIFPVSNQTGRWGLGRIKTAISWFLIPILTLVICWIAKRRNIKVMLTVADGHIFVAVALASFLTGIPYILILHDDWVGTIKKTAYVLKYFSTPIFAFAARNAAHVYSVSNGMQELLRDKYEVGSELQLPATEAHPAPGNHDGNGDAYSKNLKIVYSGLCTGGNADSLNLLIDLIKSDKLLLRGIESPELHIYSWITPEDALRAGWTHKRISIHGWVAQHELRSRLAHADMLFLPISFNEDQKYFAERSFPSKMADYLAAGKPILLLGPPYSSVARYNQEFGFAESVDEPSEERLAQAIWNVWRSPEYRGEIQSNARRAFTRNHDINRQRSAFKLLVTRLSDIGS